MEEIERYPSSMDLRKIDIFLGEESRWGVPPRLSPFSLRPQQESNVSDHRTKFYINTRSSQRGLEQIYIALSVSRKYHLPSLDFRS